MKKIFISLLTTLILENRCDCQWVLLLDFYFISKIHEFVKGIWLKEVCISFK